MPPQNDVVPVVHFLGAFIVFGFGVLYNWTQTYMSYKIYHASLTRHAGSVVLLIRLLLCFLTSIFFVLGESTSRENLEAPHVQGIHIWGRFVERSTVYIEILARILFREIVKKLALQNILHGFTNFCEYTRT